MPLRTLSVVLLLALLFLAVLLWRGALGGAFLSATEPVTAVRGALSGAAGGFFSELRSKPALQAENEELKAALSRAAALLADRDLLVEENRELKAVLGRPDAARLILAAVMLRPPGTPYDPLLIDAGAGEGVVAGALVFAGGGSAIGTVSEVYAKSARVALFSSPGASYEGLLRGSVALTVEGDGGGSFSGRIPSATPAGVGDALVLSGIAGGLMGEVSGIDAPEGDSFKTLYFHLPVNIFELRFVEVRK